VAGKGMPLARQQTQTPIGRLAFPAETVKIKKAAEKLPQPEKVRTLA
jgi:hypothetical protein